MKTLHIVLLLAASIMSSCNNLDIEKGTPRCVETKIKGFNKSSPCKDASVNEYSFQGNTVYAFGPGTCGTDMTAEVMNADCVTLGYLGGLTGNTKINGEEFSSA